MIPVVTVSQMRAIDADAIGGDTATGYHYMRKAAAGLVEAVATLVSPGAKVAVVCGKGNNGGDGYAAGAMLAQKGYRTVIYGLWAGEELRGEARMAFEESVRARVEIRQTATVDDLRHLAESDVVIDAVLGSGLAGSPSGPAATAIEAINGCGRPVIAADTPSGLDCDTGTPGSPCVRATITVAMGFPKLGQFFHPGREHVGKLQIQDLGYPTDIVARHTSGLFRLSIGDVRAMVPSRRPGGSKFDHGVVVMAAGARGMTGSAALASAAALRSGCGMVHAAVPKDILDVMAVKVTEVVWHAMPQTRQGSLSADAYASIMRLAQRAQCALIGPGISHVPATSRLVRRLVSSLPCPVVLDADGINAFKGRACELADHKSSLVITPHTGEWERLFGPMPPTPVEKVTRLREVARGYRMVIVYKGSPTVVAVPEGEAYVLDVGNSGLATAGSGDVLAGVIAGLTAQGAPLTQAALLGCWLHGRAADYAAEAVTEYGVIASDLVTAVPRAIKELNNNGTFLPPTRATS